MKISKRQKIMVGLCALGLAVVVVDRLQDKSPVFSPKNAVAAAAAPVDVAPAVEAPAMPAAPPERQSTAIARQLQQLSGEQEPAIEGLRDVFRPGPPWVVAVAESTPVADETDKVRADEFLKKHKLQAILSSGGQWQAVVDFKTLKLGDACWDDYKVTAITSQTVTLTCGTVSVTLELKK
ncbi:MAG: hypothetical protein PHU85_16230 [Phycisphaerae bacterium]|nr:hypothetical protein [Phycisphaerae bacterium]